MVTVTVALHLVVLVLAPLPVSPPRCIELLGVVAVGDGVIVGEGAGGVVGVGEGGVEGVGRIGATPRAAEASTIPPVTVIPLSDATRRTLLKMVERTCW